MINKTGLFTTLLLLLASFFNSSFAQKHTISGYVYNQETGESLIGANVLDRKSKNGTVTNDFGYFSLKVPEGKVILQVSYVGFRPVLDTLTIKSDRKMEFNLKPSVNLEAVEVVEDKTKDVAQQTQMSKVEMDMEEVKSLPRLFGEANVMRAAQLMPGIQSGNEGTSGLFVRGGSPDQNLILLDGVPLYHVSHLGGLFSVFNADAIKSMEIYKGGFPARYGGRLSSVIDIRMKDGNMKEFTGNANIGILSSKVSVEGPIIQDTTSFMLSARRSYIDLFTRPISSLASDGDVSFGYTFYDVNAKLNHMFSDKNRVFASFYVGDDRVSTRSETGNQSSFKNLNAWGNLLASLRWNHVFNQDLFGNFTTSFTRYRFKIDITQEQNGNESFIQYKSNVKDWRASADFDFYPNENHSVKFGAKGIYHIFKPGVTSFEGVTSETFQFGSETYRNFQTNAFIEDKWEITDQLKANIGVHSSAFFVSDDIYPSVQPRLSARYLLNENMSVKASYATMRQYVHLLTSSSASLPTDLWVPSTNEIEPQESRQVAAGYSWTVPLFNQEFQFNLEGYYKTMDGLITYSEGANFFATSTDWEENVESGGEGKSYGMEFRFRKKTGKLTGWIGYTLAKTTRQFENINFGEPYPYRYDRRHDISLALTYDISEKVTISGNWVYGTGQAVTLPIAQYKYLDLLGRARSQGRIYSNDRNIYLYEGKNGFRMKPYHRLDLSISLRKKIDWGERSWNLGLYNVYNRKNPYFYFFQHEPGGGKDLKQISLFPILPSISYSLKF